MTADPRPDSIAYVPVSVRAYTDVPAPRKRRGSKRVDPFSPEGRDLARKWRREYRWALVYDTETTIDHRQTLIFGVYKLCRIDWVRDGASIVPVEEGIFTADGLDRNTLKRLDRYLESNPTANVDREDPDANPTLKRLSIAEFRDLRSRLCYLKGAILVGFNLPFDESRLAASWTKSLSKGYENGFALTHDVYVKDDGEEIPSKFRPKLDVLSLDSKKSFFGFKPPRERNGVPHSRGRFLDLRTLVFAQTAASHSLESALTKAYGHPYRKPDVDLGRLDAKSLHYAREDLRATEDLLRLALSEHSRRNIDLAPDKAYSPASYGKAALKQIGIRPILQRQPKYDRELLGAATAAFYGGRAECKVRRVEVPIVVCDFLSEYPTICSLIGAWGFFKSHHIRHDELDPATVTKWLDGLTLADLYEKKTWRLLNVVCWVKSDGDDVLPVRARFDGESQTNNVAVSRVGLSEVTPYMLADVIGSRILAGKSPTIVRAVRFVPVGQADGLRDLRIPGAGKIDPYKDDYFQRLIELRVKTKKSRNLSESQRQSAQIGLKILTNATSYGINVEMNKETRPKPVTVKAYGLEEFQVTTNRPEVPGVYCYPPLGASITACGRLFLAMVEAEITNRGGVWAYADTDAMAIVATEHGTLIACPGGSYRDSEGREAIKALSYADVSEIVKRFLPLNPYDRSVIDKSVLEVEDLCLTDAGKARKSGAPSASEIQAVSCWAISPKRYALYSNRGDVRVLEKVSEHGLGLYADPRNPADRKSKPWSQAFWEWILAYSLDDSPPTDPYWFRRIAVVQRTLSTPNLLKVFDASTGVRPFCFVIHCIRHIHERRREPGRERYDLVAAYQADPSKWQNVVWFDSHTGERVGRACIESDELVRGPMVKDYKTVTYDHMGRTTRTMTGANRELIGVLSRKTVHDTTIRHIGKEMNHVEDRLGIATIDASELETLYDHPGRSAWRSVVAPALRRLSIAEAADVLGLSGGTVRLMRQGRQPHPARLGATVKALALAARGILALPDRAGDLEALARLRDAEPTCPVCQVGQVAPGATYCGRACKERAYRARRAEKARGGNGTPPLV